LLSPLRPPNNDRTISISFACFHAPDRLQLPRRLFDLTRCQVLKARSNSTTARRGLVCLPKRKYCRHVFRRDRAQTVHVIRRRIFDRWLHGCEGLHCDVVDKNPKAPAATRAILRSNDAKLVLVSARQRSVLSYDCPWVQLPRTPVVSDSR
jgi:hypothetical protein